MRQLEHPKITEDNTIRFALSLTLLVVSVVLTVSIYYEKANPINKMTMCPYYNIIAYSLTLVLYYLNDILQARFKTGELEDLTKLSFDTLLTLLLWNHMLLQNLQWDIISNAIIYQDKY